VALSLPAKDWRAVSWFRIRLSTKIGAVLLADSNGTGGMDSVRNIFPSGVPKSEFVTD
jgi:hypothetical protein